MKLKQYKPITLLILLGGFVAPSIAAEAPADQAPDIETITKKWKCKYCPDLSEDNWQTTLSIGIGYVSNDSYKFGQYNGMFEKGEYLAGGIDAQHRNDEGNYWDIQGENIGMDNGYLRIEGGKQGSYKINLEVDQITRYNLDTSRTPYNGDTDQTLPGSWVQGADTSLFTALDTSLHDINFSTERRNLSLGVEFVASNRWSYGVNIRRQTKEGNLPTAFTIGFNSSAILPMPIDYTTDDIEFRADYRYADFSGQISLSHSSFENTINGFRWDNAYDTPLGVDGQAGTAPDNTKQQIMLSGNYRGIQDVELAGVISLAQLEQNETFLPYTVNGGLAPPALPTNSLNGKVDVISTNLAAHWQYSPQQRWHFTFTHHEHNNKTARYTYTYVNTDSSLAGDRANYPYSFQDQKIKLATDYRFSEEVKLDAGVQRASIDRTYQSVETTDENTLWAKVNHRIDSDLQYSVKAEVSDRSISNYNIISDLVAVNNPNMRKYNMADRSGQKLAFNLSTSLSEEWLLNFTADVAQYDYDESLVGLQESDDFSVGIDSQYTVDEDLSFTFFVHNADIKSRQAGFSGSNWYASNDDNVITAGFGINYVVIEDKFKLGLDFVHTESSSAITMETATPAAPLPDLKSKRDTITLRGDYIYDEQLTIKASYIYEDYSEDDWAIDGIAPDTLPNVLTLGEKAPDYRIGAFWLSLHYTF